MVFEQGKSGILYAGCSSMKIFSGGEKMDDNDDNKKKCPLGKKKCSEACFFFDGKEWACQAKWFYDNFHLIA